MPLDTTRPAHEQEWGLLIAQTAQGDQAALATLYDRTSPHVYGLVLKILDNREAAEEVTLDVHTQFWRQAHAVEFLASDGETPEQDMTGQERRRYVQQALAVLTSEQREAIALAYFYGLSQSEISDKLNVPLGTVKTRMRLGMMKLRDALAPYQEGLVS
jgi:RNA polymerase sigma-70 factor (ECF subfamily)